MKNVENLILSSLKKKGIEASATPKKGLINKLSQIESGKINQDIFRGLSRGKWLHTYGILTRSRIKIFGRLHPADVVSLILKNLDTTLSYNIQIISSIDIERKSAEKIRDDVTKKFHNSVYSIAMTDDDFPHMDIGIECKNLSKKNIEDILSQYLSICSEETTIFISEKEKLIEFFCDKAEIVADFTPQLFKRMLLTFNRIIGCNISTTGYCLWYVYISEIIGNWKGDRKGLLTCEVKEENKKIKVKNYKF